MKDKIKISVIIPTYNEEKYIKNLLVALKHQDYKKKYEIVVGDSKSKDRTVKIAKNFTDKVVIIGKRTIGAGRNAAAKIAKGDIFLFMDADTVPLSNLLTEVERVFKENDVIAMSCPILPSTYNNTEMFGTWALNEVILKGSIKLHMPLFASICFAVRKDVFEKVGGFNEDLKVTEDIEFSIRLRKLKGKFKFNPNTIVIASTRRHKKWGAIKIVKSWPLGYITHKLFKMDINYGPVR